METCYQPMKQICPNYYCNKFVYDIIQLTDNFMIFFFQLGLKNKVDQLQRKIENFTQNVIFIL